MNPEGLEVQPRVEDSKATRCLSELLPEASEESRGKVGPQLPQAEPRRVTSGPPRAGRASKPQGAQSTPKCLWPHSEIRPFSGALQVSTEPLLGAPQRLASPATWRESRSGAQGAFVLKSFYEQNVRISGVQLGDPAQDPFRHLRAGDCVPKRCTDWLVGPRTTT